jgi:uncharacterized protein YciW
MNLSELKSHIARELSGIDKCNGIDLVIATTMHSVSEQTFDRLTAHLCKSHEFDEEALEHELKHRSYDLPLCFHFATGARWQFAQSVIRIAMAENLCRYYKERMEEWKREADRLARMLEDKPL